MISGIKTMQQTSLKVSETAKISHLKKAIGHCLALAVLTLPFSSVQADDLAQIFELAATNDPEIRQARASYNAAHTTIDQGRSFLLPRVTVGGSTSRDTSGPANASQFGPGHSFENGFNSKGYNLSISQALLNFEAWYAFKSAKQSDQQAAANLAQAEQQLILKVATAYFNVLRTLDNLATFRAEEDAASRVLEQTRERFEVGLIPITDVYDSQASHDLVRVNRLVEENNLNQAYEALEAITGRPHNNLETLNSDFPIESLNPSSLDEWVNLALDNNLAIKSAQFDFAAKKDDARSARATMFPTLDISAGYGWNQSANPFSFFPAAASERTNITLNFSYPLYAGGLNSARKRQAYYTRDASEEALMKTQRDSTQSTRNNYRSVETDVLAVQARAQAIISAESALEATEVGAEVGTRNVVDVVLAQRTLFQARRDYASARYAYVINTLNLKQAAGILSPQDIIDLNNWLE
ncbi:MAG: TolC family outer membrane protein [Gammaproteobacteria bacterium]|jgi:outer membrane protein|nr:TolC family outer membrane protein [Gammaproteobacteria bacterium]